MISLSWSDRGSDVTYHVWSFKIDDWIYHGSDTSFINTSLNANTTYSYKVKAAKNGIESDWSNEVSVTTWNRLPTVDAGENQFVLTGNLVSLDGSGSSDPDGDPITYRWEFTSKPTGSIATLSDSTISSPTFTLDLAGVYTLKLTVTDNYGGSSTDTVSITASTPTICGDDVVQCPNSSGFCEECDGTDDAVCSGQCIPPGEDKECTCPLSMPSWKEVLPKTDQK